MFAEKDIKKGEEILFAYGDECPTKTLFMDYGFVID